MAINSRSQAGKGAHVARYIVKMKGCLVMGESSSMAEKKSPRKMWTADGCSTDTETGSSIRRR